MNNLKLLPKSNGFTLIELLIVVGIIGALAALLFPVLSAARANAQKATCLSNLHQIGSAIALYVQDYDDYLPYAPDCSTKKWALKGQTVRGEPLDSLARILPDIRAVLLSYGATGEIFRCPSDRLDSLGRADLKPTWFEEDGASYQYSDWNSLRVTKLGSFPLPANSFLMGDNDGFHNPLDEPPYGMYNVLHLDFHVKTLTVPQRQEALNNSEIYKEE